MDKFESTLDYARRLDEEDCLRSYKERFYIHQGEIYMDGNSCGLCSIDAEETLLKAMAAWKEMGIGIWTKGGYILYQDKLGAMLAPLVNADPEEVTCGNSTTVNVHQGILTFYKPTPQRNKILMDDLSFPTDKYAVYSDIRATGYDPAECLKVVPSRDGNTISEADIIAAMTDDVCVILLPSVLYRSAQLIDMEKITKEAHKRGIYVGFDLCHSIGVIPHDFKQIDPDFAVWCNYKFLNGGPGAMAGLYINKKHFGMAPGLAGWWGNKKETQFNLSQQYEHAQYAGGWQIGTEAVLSMAPLEGSLNMIQRAGLENIRVKSLRITAYLMYLIDEKLTSYGFGVGNPREDRVRGGHVALTHDDALRINEALKANQIIPDFRYPNVIRLAPAPLYTSYEDVFDMVERIIKIMENHEYEEYVAQNREGLDNQI